MPQPQNQTTARQDNTHLSGRVAQGYRDKVGGLSEASSAEFPHTPMERATQRTRRAAQLGALGDC